MKNKIFRLAILMMVLLMVPFQAMAQDKDLPTNDAGMPYMPAFFKDSTLDLTPYAGKAIFINFFTAWCPICMEEMPNIKKALDAYSPDEVVVLLVHVWDNEDGDAGKTVVEKYSLQNATLFEDQDQSVASLVGIPGYPTSLFIGKDGYLYKALAQGLSYDDMAGYLDGMGVAKQNTAVTGR